MKMKFINLKKEIEKLKTRLWWFYSFKIEDESISRISEEAATLIGIKPFKNIRVSSRFRMANAAVVGFRCRTVVLTRTLLELLNVDELKAVFLHEYAHCKLKHQLKLMVVSISLLLGAALFDMYVILTLESEVIALGISIPLLISFYILILILSRFITKRFELEADCLAISKLGNPFVFIDILKKIRAVNGEVRGWKAIISPHPPIDVRITSLFSCLDRVKQNN